MVTRLANAINYNKHKDSFRKKRKRAHEEDEKEEKERSDLVQAMRVGEEAKGDFVARFVQTQAKIRAAQSSF